MKNIFKISALLAAVVALQGCITYQEAPRPAVAPTVTAPVAKKILWSNYKCPGNMKFAFHVADAVDLRNRLVFEGYEYTPRVKVQTGKSMTWSYDTTTSKGKEYDVIVVFTSGRLDTIYVSAWDYAKNAKTNKKPDFEMNCVYTGDGYTTE